MKPPGTAFPFVALLCALLISSTPFAQNAESTDNLLALTWQPAFCEYRPNKPECRRLNNGELPAAGRRLSLHGLWPQPRGSNYCGVSQSVKALDKKGRWVELPEPDVDADTRAALGVAMPGVDSFLDRHEWIKHGTCYFGAGGADEYFDDTLRLMDEINQSDVGRFLEGRVGRRVEASELRDAFDRAFGDGAGDRVAFTCGKDGGRVLVREFRINLHGVITPHSSLADLLMAASPVAEGCGGGILDPVGLQ